MKEHPTRVLAASPDASQPTMPELSKMLDSLLVVQRTLTRARDHKRLALLSALTSELQDDYLSLLERAANA